MQCHTIKSGIQLDENSFPRKQNKNVNARRQTTGKSPRYTLITSASQVTHTDKALSPQLSQYEVTKHIPALPGWKTTV